MFLSLAAPPSLTSAFCLGAPWKAVVFFHLLCPSTDTGELLDSHVHVYYPDSISALISALLHFDFESPQAWRETHFLIPLPASRSHQVFGYSMNAWGSSSLFLDIWLLLRNLLLMPSSRGTTGLSSSHQSFLLVSSLSSLSSFPNKIHVWSFKLHDDSQIVCKCDHEWTRVQPVLVKLRDSQLTMQEPLLQP